MKYFYFRTAYVTYLLRIGHGWRYHEIYDPQDVLFRHTDGHDHAIWKEIAMGDGSLKHLKEITEEQAFLEMI